MEPLQQLVQNIAEMVRAGGPIMWVLAALSLVLYRDTARLVFFLQRLRLTREDPLGLAALGEAPELAFPLEPVDFEERRWHLRQFVQARLFYLQALLVASPLLGLLGTVMGMLQSFEGLSLQAGEETARTVAEGISRALITTQTGLIIAIPGLALALWVRRLLRGREQELLQLKVDFGRESQAGLAAAAALAVGEPGGRAPC